jgi:lipopolysaccharide/colanic/teichoic acid biosynthesis glycosyltransferase
MKPRIARATRLMRKLHIAELPQMLDILRGEMSFIGSRPESIDLTKPYENGLPCFDNRNLVRPRVFGWAQVNRGYAARTDALKIKPENDLYYINFFSFWLGMLITFQAIRAIISGFGSK